MDTTRKLVHFITTVEKYSVLYDHHSDDYSNRIIQEKSWRLVAKEVNQPAMVCRRKWRHIRGAYLRYLNNKKRFGSTKRYYLADYLQFLTPYLKPRDMNLDFDEDHLIKLIKSRNENQPEDREFSFSESSVSTNTKMGVTKCEELDEFDVNEADLDSTNKIIKLIQEIEKYRELYDHRSSAYTNRVLQKKAWTEIAKEINETESTCRDKWKHIRSSYLRYLNKQAQETGSTKRYYLADYLEFLNPFVKPKHLQGGFEGDEEDSINFIKCGDEIDEAGDGDLSCSESSSVSINIKDPLITQAQLKLKRNSDLLEKNDNEYFTPQPKVEPVDEDPDLLFFKSLLPSLRKMTDLEKHHFKSKILDTIGDILYKTSTGTGSN